MTKILVKMFIKDYEQTEKSTVRQKYGGLSGVVGIILNVILFASKLTVGTLAGSISITADAFNNLTDASSSVLTIIGFKLSEKPADKDHPYGHARYEYIAGLGVAVIILVVGVELFIGSFQKILNPSPITLDLITICVLIFSMIVKAWLYVFNRFLGTEINSKVLIATGLDSKNDMFATAGVLFGMLISVWTNTNLDGYFGLLVSIMILYGGYGIVSETLSVLLGERPDPELALGITKKIKTYEGVLGSHDLIVHDYGPGHRFASIHVEMDASMPAIECHEIIDTIERDFKAEKLEIVIHYDPIITDNEEICLIRQKLENILLEMSEKLHFHDFRVVFGEKSSNLIFDLVVPENFEMTKEELKIKIDNKLGADFSTTITFDVDFS